MEPGSSNIENLMGNYDLYDLMKEPTCYKSNPPKCYDLILTNKKYSYIIQVHMRQVCLTTIS